MQYNELLERTRSQLESGQLPPEALEKLLDRDTEEPRREARPDLAGILVALGLSAAYAGFAMLVAIGFRDQSRSSQMVVPFLFPAASIGLAILLARAGRPRWEVEAAGLIGQTSLALAFVALGAVLDPADVPRFGALCGLVGVVEVLVCHRAIGSVRLTGWGLSASLVAVTGFGASATASLELPVILLGQGVVAVGVTWLLVSRSSPYAPHAARAAALLIYGASVIGLDRSSWGQLGSWHLLLTLAVVGTFLAAAILRMDALVWVGALGGLLWLGAFSAVVGDSGGAAAMVVLGGFGLIGLGFLVRSIRQVALSTPMSS